MVSVGDRYRLPVTYGSSWKGEETGFAVGTVVALLPRYAVVEFSHGVRECFPLYGPGNLSGM